LAAKFDPGMFFRVTEVFCLKGIVHIDPDVHQLEPTGAECLTVHDGNTVRTIQVKVRVVGEDTVVAHTMVPASLLTPYQIPVAA